MDDRMSAHEHAWSYKERANEC